MAEFHTQSLVFGLTPFTGRDVSHENEHLFQYQGQFEGHCVNTNDPEENPEDVPTQPKASSISQRLHCGHAMHALTNDEHSTYTSMLSHDEDAEVFVMPNHRIDEAGNIKGFRLVVNRDSDCVNLPITREMFTGTT